MILDLQAMFSDDQALTTSAASTNVIDADVVQVETAALEQAPSLTLGFGNTTGHQ